MVLLLSALLALALATGARAQPVPAQERWHFTVHFGPSGGSAEGAMRDAYDAEGWGGNWGCSGIPDFLCPPGPNPRSRFDHGPPGGAIEYSLRPGWRVGLDLAPGWTHHFEGTGDERNDLQRAAAGAFGSFELGEQRGWRWWVASLGAGLAWHRYELTGSPDPPSLQLAEGGGQSRFDRPALVLFHRIGFRPFREISVRWRVEARLVPGVEIRGPRGRHEIRLHEINPMLGVSLHLPTGGWRPPPRTEEP